MSPTMTLIAATILLSLIAALAAWEYFNGKF